MLLRSNSFLKQRCLDEHLSFPRPQASLVWHLFFHPRGWAPLTVNEAKPYSMDSSRINAPQYPIPNNPAVAPN